MVDEKKLQKFQRQVDAMVKKLFTYEDGDGTKVRVFICDTSRYESGHYSFVPHSHLAKTPDDYTRILAVAEMNVSAAHSGFQRALRLFLSEHRDVREQRDLMTAVRKAIGDRKPVTLEHNSGFHSLKTPGETRFATVPDDVLFAKNRDWNYGAVKAGYNDQLADRIKVLRPYLQFSAKYLMATFGRRIQRYALYDSGGTSYRLYALVAMTPAEKKQRAIQLEEHRLLIRAERVREEAEKKEKSKPLEL